jgi:hypothetical protein
LAAYGVYSLCPPSYWLHMEYIIDCEHPLGRTLSIFLASGILLAAYGVYSKLFDILLAAHGVHP